MTETSYLAATSTTGYTEQREATYNDDGSIRQVIIYVKWDSGEIHTQTLTLGGPPDYTFSSVGALVYPDGSHTSVIVPPDGTLVIEHAWDWVSPHGPDQSEKGSHRWSY
ncbi:hypothetical protein [Microbacterium hominis]|uniref:Uncharacterized protein n=1 Tax=Microbacterium hominis TaxID=162426 RepID=A0A7D4PKC9_9MICO|nr:hypothetical protein [Microbacterium hominis]QKJ18055.1 hypothetical protein HQM25_00565 [Microbacterium hominis]